MHGEVSGNVFSNGSCELPIAMSGLDNRPKSTVYAKNDSLCSNDKIFSSN